MVFKVLEKSDKWDNKTAKRTRSPRYISISMCVAEGVYRLSFNIVSRSFIC